MCSQGVVNIYNKWPIRFFGISLRYRRVFSNAFSGNKSKLTRRKGSASSAAGSGASCRLFVEGLDVGSGDEALDFMRACELYSLTRGNKEKTHEQN